MGGGNACCFRLWRAAKRNGAFAERFRLSLRVAGFSVITALAGYPYFGNHSAGGKRVVVAHHPCGQPMHHSVLSVMGGGVLRRWSSSSKQVVARESRMAKRNPRLARVRTGGIAPLPSPLPSREQPLTADPLIRTNSDQTSNPSSCYFCGVKSLVTDFTLFFEKKHNSRLCMIFLYFCSMFSTENWRSLVIVQSLFVCQRNLANFNQQQKSNYSDHVCNRRGLFFVFCLGFARTSLTTKTGHAFFLYPAKRIATDGVRSDAKTDRKTAKL